MGKKNQSTVVTNPTSSISDNENLRADTISMLKELGIADDIKIKKVKTKDVTKITEIANKPKRISSKQESFRNKTNEVTGENLAPISFSLKHPACTIEDEGTAWFDVIPEIPKAHITNKTDNGEQIKASTEDIRRLRNQAKALLEKEVKIWEIQKEKRMTGDDKYLSQVLKGGTLSDKISALTIRCKESPIHRLDDLDKLVDMASKRDRRTSQMAQEALKDLFISDLLPDSRRLLPFRLQPFHMLNLWAKTDAAFAGKMLLLWYFEGELLRRYGLLITALESATKDTVSSTKKSGMDIIKDLLEAKPTGEVQLLAILINKFGDPSRKTANTAIQLLQSVLEKHYNMRGVVVREVQQYLHRPGLAPKAVYAGVIFLTQVYLKSIEDCDLAAEMIGTYFKLFERAVQADDLKSRLLSALLTGVNRAHPYLEPGSKVVENYIDQLFKLVHCSKFGTATQALMLIYQVTNANSESNFDHRESGERFKFNKDSPLTTRFYNALYAKLADPELRVIHQPTLFLNLVFKSMKYDMEIMRVAAISKRLLQVAILAQPPLAGAALFIVSEVQQRRISLRKILFSNSPNHEIATKYGDKELSQDLSLIPGYDPQKRDPRYAFGEQNGLKSDKIGVCLWEVALLRWHYHPSVQHFATELLTGPNHSIRYHGDPLIDFSLMPFLDKLAYRNPKKNVPLKKAMTKQLETTFTEEDVMNSEAFLSLPAESVSADRMFFHKFFKEKAHRDSRKGVKKAKNVIQEAGVFEEFIDDDERDKFANKLARELMRSAGDIVDDDDDDNDDDESSIFSHDGGSVDGDLNAVLETTANSSEDENDSDVEVEGLEGIEHEDIENNGSDDDADEKDMDEIQESSSKKKKSKLSNGSMSAFASADDYADVLDQFDPDMYDGSNNAYDDGQNDHHNKKNPKKRNKREKFGNKKRVKK